MFQAAILFFFLIAWSIYLTVDKSSFRPTSATWNPNFTDSLNRTLPGVTYTGNYNVVGKMVFFCVNVQFTDFPALIALNNGIGSNTPSAYFNITLPFPARQTFTCRGGTLHNLANTKYHIAGIMDTLVNTDKTKLIFYYSGSTSDLYFKFNTPVGWNTGTGNTSAHFDVSGFYETD